MILILFRELLGLEDNVDPKVKISPIGAETNNVARLEIDRKAHTEREY